MAETHISEMQPNKESDKKEVISIKKIQSTHENP